MPSSTPQQAKAMQIAAAGKSNLGIPKSVGEDFHSADLKKKAMAHALRNAKTRKPKQELGYAGNEEGEEC